MIAFQNVSFSYDGTVPVVEDLSFSISSGESVGLIGANGAGKSTIMKLMLGLLTGQGKIFVGDLEMNKQNLPKRDGVHKTVSSHNRIHCCVCSCVLCCFVIIWNRQIGIF